MQSCSILLPPILGPWHPSLTLRTLSVGTGSETGFSCSSLTTSFSHLSWGPGTPYLEHCPRGLWQWNRILLYRSHKHPSPTYSGALAPLSYLENSLRGLWQWNRILLFQSYDILLPLSWGPGTSYLHHCPRGHRQRNRILLLRSHDILLQQFIHHLFIQTVSALLLQRRGK
jgi:hypothetical protein